MKNISLKCTFYFLTGNWSQKCSEWSQSGKAISAVLLINCILSARFSHLLNLIYCQKLQTMPIPQIWLSILSQQWHILLFSFLNSTSTWNLHNSDLSNKPVSSMKAPSIILKTMHILLRFKMSSLLIFSMQCWTVAYLTKSSIFIGNHVSSSAVFIWGYTVCTEREFICSCLTFNSERRCHFLEYVCLALLRVNSG